jgi:hypothetical protein
MKCPRKTRRREPAGPHWPLPPEPPPVRAFAGCVSVSISAAVSYREVQGVVARPAVVTYAVALHEIGHIKGRHQDSRRCIVRERWAWDWAKRNAFVWTPRMARCAAESLQWYADGHAAVVDQNWQPPSIA